MPLNPNVKLAVILNALRDEAQSYIRTITIWLSLVFAIKIYSLSLYFHMVTVFG